MATWTGNAIFLPVPALTQVKTANFRLLKVSTKAVSMATVLPAPSEVKQGVKYDVLESKTGTFIADSGGAGSAEHWS